VKLSISVFSKCLWSKDNKILKITCTYSGKINSTAWLQHFSSDLQSYFFHVSPTVNWYSYWAWLVHCHNDKHHYFTIKAALNISTVRYKYSTSWSRGILSASNTQRRHRPTAHIQVIESSCYNRNVCTSHGSHGSKPIYWHQEYFWQSAGVSNWKESSYTILIMLARQLQPSNIFVSFTKLQHFYKFKKLNKHFHNFWYVQITKKFQWIFWQISKLVVHKINSWNQTHYLAKK